MAKGNTLSLFFLPISFRFRRTAISYQPLSKNQAKSFARLLHKKDRAEAGAFLVEGVRLCQELFASSLTVTDLIFTGKLVSLETGGKLLDMADAKKIQVWETNDETLSKLCDTTTPQPVVACARMRESVWPAAFASARRLLVLHDVTDPGNVGTLLRSAEAFGWDGVVCTGSTTELYNPKVMRAAMGSAFRLPVHHTEAKTLLSFFVDNGVTSVVSTPGRGTVPPLPDLPAKLALWMGNEAHGIGEELIASAARQVQLPMAAHVESLNVAVAGGILLFLLR